MPESHVRAPSFPMSTPIHPPLCPRSGALDVPVPDVDPSRWDGVEMDLGAFRALPRVPGFKYELLDGTVIEGLRTDTFGSVPQIDVLFVAPEAQRRGIGTALLHAFARAVHADDESRIVSSSHPANRASRNWHRSLSFYPLPSRSLIRHIRTCLQANLEHGHVLEADGRPASAMLGRIATRLQAAERERFAAAHPIQWTREEDLLEQHLVS